MSEKPPVGPFDSAGSGSTDPAGGQIVNIENYHYAGNDLAELAKIAAIDPNLAQRVVEQRDKSDQREHTSERIGMITIAGLSALTLLTILLLIFYGGVWELAIGILLIISLAVLARVILTGEWSDASWIGSTLNSVTKTFGGLPQDSDSEGKND